MLEYQPIQTKEDFQEQNSVVTSQSDGKLCLTKLWEIILRTNRLPDGISESFLYDSVREKLRDPEREVRQHALRVLMDLIRVTQSSNLDVRMHELVPDILKILGHSAPSLKKSALDLLKQYLKLSRNYNQLIKELINSPDNLISAVPFLVTSETDDATVILVVDQLWKDLESPNINQEIPAKSLARLRYNLGDDRFKHLIGLDNYRKLQEICEIYGLPIDYSDGEMIDDRDIWSGEEIIEDRVILETEITLKSGPPITMKLHEESRPNSAIGSSGEIEDSKFGVIKILNDDSESDYEEAARRTPRKVRFGGESVKLRTPESDSSNQDEPNNSLNITVVDAVSITTKKSLIPVRISSLPSTPLRRSNIEIRGRLYKSAPNLSRNYGNSKIPFRRDSNLKEKFKEVKDKERVKPKINIKSKSSDHLVASKVVTPISSPRTISRSNNVSPVPPHKEIEVLHNLARSPTRIRRSSTVDISDDKETNENGSSLNSFQLCPLFSSQEDSISTEKICDEYYDSFQVYPLPQESLVSTLPPPDDVRNRNSIYLNKNSMNTCSSSDNDTNISRDTNQQLFGDFLTPQIKSLDYNQMQRLEYISSNEKNDYDSFLVYPADSVDGKNDIISKEESVTNTVNAGLDFNKHWQLSSLSSEDNLWNKSEALDNLMKMLKQPGTCESLEPGPAALLFEALFACQHLDKLHFLADDALALMIKGVRPEVLEQCLGRVSLGICKIGAPSGVGLALMIMKKSPPKRFLTEVMDRCFAHKTREGALQVMMASARLLPRNDLEIVKMTEFSAATLRDRRRRVRHAALETLATLAQLSSIIEVLQVVERVTKAAPDHQYLLRVVRTRLSRRQLPTVELDGTIRYSTPRDQTELEWLAGNVATENQSVSSSASSSNHSVNYWRRNSRHEGNDKRIDSAQSSVKDDTVNGNQQIWAVDPSVFPRNGRVKDNNIKGNPSVLRPVYILQPEAVTEGGRGHRRYDRGRSFSPPKPNQKHSPPHVTASATHEHAVTTPRHFNYKEGVRKSFSSEQLFIREKEHHDPYSFSLSSRSSTTSTGSSTKSGTWHKEMRSGIPVPITSETKFRLRTNTTSTISAAGPVVARRSALGSIPDTPIISRLSPRDTPEKHSAPIQALPPPPLSSGSESSGYFTPPPETKKAFVKLDSIDRTSESEDREEDVANDDNNNNVQEPEDNIDIPHVIEKRNVSASSSAETTQFIEESIQQTIKTSPSKSEIFEKEETKMPRFSISRSKEPSFIDKSSPILEKRTKSKSVVDLQNFLPEISPNRKNINSAPLFKDNLIPNGNLVISSYEEIKTIIPIATHDINENPGSPSKEITITRKLSRRLSRTQSKRSIKSTPRNETPSSSRANTNKPKDTLSLALTQLNNPEWEVMIQGLQTLTRIAKYYPEVIEGQMHTVCINLAKHIKNLRSQVARTACHTASELFGSCKRGLEMELEEIAGPLLHRTADTNKFLRADANAALDVMCEHVPTNRIVTVITSKGCNHQNSVVRSAAIRLITDLVKRHGGDKVFQMNKDIRDKIILAGANSLADGSVEARNHGKELISHLVGHPQFQKNLLEAVPQTTLRHIAKTLNSVKPFVKT